MTYTYWKRHPRNFGNEYEIGIASTSEDAEQYEAEGFKRINRETALGHLSYHRPSHEQLYRSVTINGHQYETPCNEIARRLRKGADLT